MRPWPVTIGPVGTISRKPRGQSNSTRNGCAGLWTGKDVSPSRSTVTHVQRGRLDGRSILIFQISKHARHRVVLEEFIGFFGCGKVRGKGPGSTVMVYAVDRMKDIERQILPFFEQQPLRVKADFLAFASIGRSMQRKEHFTRSGFERTVRMAYSMNAYGKQRRRRLNEILAGSSETAREAPMGDMPCLWRKIQSELHGDMQSQAEMT